MQMLSTHEKHIKVTGAFQMYIFNAFDNVIDSLPYSNYLIEMQFEVRCGDELAPSIGKRFMSTPTSTGMKTWIQVVRTLFKSNIVINY